MKKHISILLVVVLSLSLLVGCGGKGKTEEKPATGGEQTGEVGNIGSKESPVTVKIIAKDVSPDDEDIKLLVEEIENGLAEEEKYVKIEYLEAPAGKFGESVPLAFRTGQIDPDIIYFQGGDLPIVNDGMLEDLTPYIEKSENINNLLEDHNKQKIKNYPYLLWLSPARVSVPVMRKDIAEKMDTYETLLEDPTVENYHNFFKELVEKDLTKYAFTADGDLTRLDSIFNHAFGVTGTVVKENDNWTFAKATNFEKDKLEFYAKLHEEGLIDPEYITKKWDTMEKAFYDSDVAIVSSTAGKVIDIYNEKMTQTQGEDAELIVLPPAKGVSQGYTSVDVTKESRGFAINSQSEVKDAAFAVLDFMAGPVGRKLDLIGIEGKHYEIKDDEIVFTDKFPEWWPRFWETQENFSPEPELKEKTMSEPAYEALAKAKEFYKEDTNIIIPQELLPQWDAMMSLYREYASDIVRGIKPIDSFDEFVEKWNESGGDEFKEYLNQELNK